MSERNDSLSPIALASGFGLLHRAASSAARTTGVVLCSAWGIHELSSRKMMFRLASQLAAVGLAALRFDYPGTADALDATGGFDTWVAAASDAADRLKTACGLDSVIMAGVGIGATVAFLAAAPRRDIAGVVLAAPVVSGKRYVREIALAAPAVEEVLGLQPSQRPAGVSIGGIVMPPEVAANLKSVDLMVAKTSEPRPVLVVARPGHSQEEALADQLGRYGWSMSQAPFNGFDAAMDNPTISVLPKAVIDKVTDWCLEVAPATGVATIREVPIERVTVQYDGFREEPVAFGRGLFGVMTLPEQRSAAATVIFLNSGYDHHSGWAYQWTRTARALAAAGIASLRFDMANIGDSAARPDVPDQVLYGEGQQADIAAALVLLSERGDTSAMLVGRCSGAYAAFHATARNAMISAAVMINPLRLIWDPDEDVDTTIRVGPRSMADYRQRALNSNVLKRLVDGNIDVRGAAMGLGTQLARRVARRFAPLAGSMSKITRLRRQCLVMMESMKARGKLLRFVCSERDASVEYLAFHFGGDHGGLRRFPNASLTRVPDADHNMTPEAAHLTVVEIIRETALQFPADMKRAALAAAAAADDEMSISEVEIRARA